ncbi:MAG: universal stress protein [Bacteroidetes bacterium]|nr:universal stress protein [Bacteroidota bacterium]MBS1934046.1 universal stress protein [Bacteroidota bacterium]
MKKILFICDGDHFSKGAMDFIASLNGKERVLARGMFVTPADFQQLLPISYIPIAAPYIELKEKEQKLVKESKDKFIDFCIKNHINFDVIEESDEWNAEMIATETRFADLAVISEELLFSSLLEEQPNVFMKELLRHTECPVMIVSEQFKFPERLIIAYDGKRESMYALKQFCYALPELTELPTEIVFIKSEENENIPEEKLLKEYARAHFNSLNIEKLHFDAAKYFTTWAEQKKNSLIISGSFGRSALSELFRKSFAKEIIHEHKMPAFIAHV